MGAPPSSRTAPLDNPFEAHPLESVPHSVSCVVCGYSQQGQPVNRCSECGLLFASQVRDPTSWSLAPAEWAAWWETAVGVWGWDRRIRVRTGLVPVTPESASFARRSVVLAAPMLGAAIAVLMYGSGRSPAVVVSEIAGYCVLGAAVAGVLMFLALMGLRLALQGRWRRELSFVPASIDYAAAWWPPLAVAAFLLAGTYRVAGPQAALPVMLLMGASTGLWLFWLWGSITESQNVRFVGLRVFVMLLLASFAGQWIWAGALSSSRMLLRQLSAQVSPARGSVTYAFIVDLKSARIDPVVSAQIGRLGVRPENAAVVGPGCTVEAFKIVLGSIRSRITKNDRLVVYLNARGGLLDSSGALRLADGKLSDDQLNSLFSSTPTDRCLIAVEAEDARPFCEALKRSCRAVFVTAPDVPAYAYADGLKDFWAAFDEPESDADGDGRITVVEAFEATFRPMIASLKAARERVGPTASEVFEAEPVLEVLGKAEKADFSVAVPARTP